MVFLYDFVLFCYRLFIRAAAPFHQKAKQWTEGRKEVWQKLQQQLDASRPVIWMHCASLGEFEQGRPVLEAWRQLHPKDQIVLSFFSPSGYEIRKNYAGADIVTYLPLDTKSNARRWLQLLQPRLVFFVKYEFWHHYLSGLKAANCPAFLVAGSFREEQLFFRPYGKFFRQILFCFDHIFVQQKKDSDLLRSIGFPSVSIAGDPRVDRVLEIAQSTRHFPLIENFSKDHQVLIFGSSWQPEEKIFARHLHQQQDLSWKYIIAPHDISEPHLQAIESLLPQPVLRYSQANEKNIQTFAILLIDNIGMLSALYRYGNLAFIGGGFGAGIHNILEPVAFHLPVIFGPRYEKFPEARELVQTGGAFAIGGHEDFEEIFAQLKKPTLYQAAADQCRQYLNKHQGATKKIMEWLEGFEQLHN